MDVVVAGSADPEQVSLFVVASLRAEDAMVSLDPRTPLAHLARLPKMSEREAAERLGVA